MGHIRKLDPVISNKIAAGEVVEKLANVIKELVENSIDANAKNIDIDLLDSGLKLMRVIDDGQGMDEEDLLQAFDRHATSKIITVNDLFRITSLGFRGEAIPSIASISKMTITSKQNKQAKCVVFDNGKFIEMKDGHLNKGTKVEVEKIFHYTPARFKYLKSDQYELALIQSLVYQFALSYPEISFRLSNNNKLLFTSNGDGNIKNLMAQIYGSSAGQSLINFKAKSRNYNIYGYTSKPIVNRSNKNYIHIIVNQRVIQDPQIVRAILEGYDQLIPKQRYPICTLYIEVDPILIDVNVHPRKQEIKFSDKRVLLDFITSTIAKEMKNKPIFQMPKDDYQQTTFTFQEKTNKLSDETLYIEEDNSSNKPEETQVPEKEIIPDLFYIGQYSGTYLIFQNDLALYMVDQHAAAERIRYERYIYEMTLNNQAIKKTFIPLKFDFPSHVLMTIKEHKKEIKKIGLSIKFYNDYILVEEIPYWFPEGYENIYIESIIDLFTNEEDVSKNKLLDDLAILLACKHSLKANHYITKEEADHLISDLRKCERPYTCPHGRPIIVEISHQKIEHWFNRLI